MRPSLFAHAPSELSQDAFLTWLLLWAHAAHAAEDGALHAVGQALLAELFRRAEPPVPDLGPIKLVEVRRQHLHIDLLVVVNGSRALILEDKVHAGQHDNQLERYRRAIAGSHEQFAEGVHGIYVKTGSQSDTESVRKAGYGYFDRQALSALLNEGLANGVTNAIYLDFAAHLAWLDSEFGAWETRPVALWSASDRLWEAFFHAVMARLSGAQWRYLANAQGGQFGLWIPGTKLPDDCWAYVQVDSRKRLHIRLWTPEGTDKPGLSRNTWAKAVEDHAKGMGLPLGRPDRMGTGRTMAIAELSSAWPPTRSDGLVDLGAAVDAIERADSVVRMLARTDGRT